VLHTATRYSRSALRASSLGAVVTTAALCLLTLLPATYPARAQESATQQGGSPLLDPFDPFDVWGSDELFKSEDDSEKTVDQLINEATLLLSTERLLDARTKLLKALAKDPKDYRIHQLLSGYYLVHVGHYRLALKYIMRAEELFIEKHGAPPYRKEQQRREHSSILYYLSQVRLNLDNYQGSLETLDRFTALGYFGDWYPGSRAWVLMKLGNLKEAIRVARAGVVAGVEQGRILNMLGILLSMNDQPQEALDVFRTAIATEMAFGTEGQPATPLNNAGEVYRELFEDDKAESSFLRATSLPDGCEHLLPTLNLVLLYIEQTKFQAAASALDNFEKCIARYPLRNSEEHAALSQLARGRIDLHTGHIERAISRFEAALEGTQWFGKIGTNQDDLLVGATISLAQALAAQNERDRFTLPQSWSQWAKQKRDISTNAIRAWWLFRRARQMLVSDLNDIEDLTIRNTDSLLEYPTLGDVLSDLSPSGIARRLSAQRQRDKRGPASLFYDLYSTQNSLRWWNHKASITALDAVIERARTGYDELLRIQAILTRLRLTPPSSNAYKTLAYRVFFATPAQLRNHGFALPVRIQSDLPSAALRNAVAKGPFLEYANGSEVCTIETGRNEAQKNYTLRFSCAGNISKNRTVEDSDINQVVNKLSDALFSEEISNGRNN
jgi:tetratricopeptide (TPR) repeat protein